MKTPLLDNGPGVPFGTLKFVEDRPSNYDPWMNNEHSRYVLHLPKLTHDADCADNCHCRQLVRLAEGKESQ